MRLLLPPSEAKTPGGRGRPLRERLDGPLAEGRLAVAGALHRLVTGDFDVARQALLLPDGVAADALAANACVLDSPTMPALRRYAGVVYDGLRFAHLPPAVQRVAARHTLVFSGLFGVVRGDAPVPLYRVPAKATLPGVGVAATFWRPRLDAAVPELLGDGLVLDLRSGDYAAMWRPRRELAERVVAVRVLSPKPSGGFGVVSYTSKLAKGRLAAELFTRIAAGTTVHTRADVERAWTACGGVGSASGPRGELDLYTA